MRILVVDDDIGTRKVLSRFLPAGGHEADACESGPLALERLAVVAYDALLTDLVMPEMTGLDLATRALALYPSLRCFIMSGHPAPEESLPGVAWVSKPIDLDSLLSLLAS